ncbi:MAG: hypothetical protein ACOCRK_03070 [bacterium]
MEVIKIKLYDVHNEYNSNLNTYTDVIVIGEQCAGNESVGNMWLETKTFDKNTKVDEIIKWASEKNISGRLIITIDESTVEERKGEK